MALADLFNQPGRGVQGFSGLGDLLGSIGYNPQDYLGYASDMGGAEGSFYQTMKPELFQQLGNQGYDISHTGSTSGGNAALNLSQNGQQLGSFADDSFGGGLGSLMSLGDKVMPYMPYLAAAMMTAGGAGAFGGGGAAGAGGTGTLGGGLADLGTMPGTLGSVGTTTGAALPEVASVGSIGSGVGSMGVGTPYTAFSTLPNLGSMPGTLSHVGQISSLPSMAMSSVPSVPSLGGLGSTVGAVAGNMDKAKMLGAEGFGEGMSGASTGMFDGVLGMTGSPGMANAATTASAPLMNSPVIDQLRRLLGGNKLLTRGLQTGLGLLSYNQNKKGIKNQIGDLQSLYGPNSAYSQQLKQELERKDAASGRRSQYGPRNVELQARLAQQASQLAPTLAQLHSQGNSQRDRVYRDVGGLLETLYRG